VGSTPDDGISVIHTAVLSAIAHAERSVHITNVYFVPDRQLVEQVKAAAQRGIDVRLILPGHSDFWAPLYAGRAYYDELLRAGVKLYERRDALLHAKTAVVDQVWSTVGSANLDRRSFLNNDEVNAVILGEAFAVEMESMFQADLAKSTEITRDTWRRRGLDSRIKEIAARLWQRWL
jgi:cardiolipin synthase